MKIEDLEQKDSIMPGTVIQADTCECNATCSACSFCAACISCIFIPLLAGALGGVLAGVTYTAVQSIIPQTSTTCFNGGC